jgi:hypothetical protein
MTWKSNTGASNAERRPAYLARGLRQEAWVPILFDAAATVRDSVFFVGLVGCSILVLLALAGAP